jgi:hypothetical protein
MNEALSDSAIAAVFSPATCISRDCCAGKKPQAAIPQITIAAATGASAPEPERKRPTLRDKRQWLFASGQLGQKYGQTSLYYIVERDWPNSEFFRSGQCQVLRFFRAFLATVFAVAAIAKSSNLLPPFIAATSHLGRRPRPAQVSAGFSGLRYLGATAPLGPPRPAARPRRPPSAYPANFDSSVSSSWRRAPTFALIAASTLALRSCSLAIDIDLRAIHRILWGGEAGESA